MPSDNPTDMVTRESPTSAEGENSVTLPSVLEIRERRSSRLIEDSEGTEDSRGELVLPPLSTFSASKKSCERFYEESDLEGTKARYISRYMKVNIARLAQPLSTN